MNNNAEPHLDRKQIQKLLSLVAAANYFELPGLAQKVKRFLRKLIKELPARSLALLEACREAGPSMPEELTKFAWSQVLVNAMHMRNTNAMDGLSQDTLEEILKDKKVEASEFELFSLLLSWAERSLQVRKPVAKQMVHRIQLDRINPVNLSTVVKSSGLVTSDQLLEAYEKQALKHPISVEEKRFEPWVWAHTSSQVCTRNEGMSEHWTVLQCDPIASGVHKWTLEPIGDYSGRLAGVISTALLIDPDVYLAQQIGVWGFRMDGIAFREEELLSVVREEQVQLGDRVVLSLDLRQGQLGNGILGGCCIQKKSGDEILYTPITNLLGRLASHPHGFVPAVEIGDNSGFRLLDFQKEED